MKTLNALVIGRYNDAVKKLSSLFLNQKDSTLQLAGSTTSEDEALKMIDKSEPQIILLALNGGDNDLFELASRIFKYKPHIIMVVYTENATVELYNTAIECGVRYVGNYPANYEALSERLIHIADEEDSRQSFLREEKKTVIEESKVIAFYSPRAGVGNTTQLVNLAIDLAKHNKTVMILDMDTCFGDVCSYLNVTPRKTLSDICQDFAKTPTVTELSSYITLHSSGVQVLASPLQPEQSDYVEIPKILSLISTLNSYYDFILLDMPDGLTDTHVELFKLCTYIYMTTKLDIPQLRNTKKAIITLDAMPFDFKRKIRILVNNVTKQSILKLSDVHQIVDCPIILSTIDDQRTAQDSTNRGLPMMINATKSEIVASIHNLTKFSIAKGVPDFDIWDIKPDRWAQAYNNLGANDVIPVKKSVTEVNESVGKKKWGLFSK